MSVGNAARNGLLSALLAAQNFTGPDAPLDGERGFLRVFGMEQHFEELLDGLGSKWEVLNNTYKPYPCGVILNPVIQACLELHQLFTEFGGDSESIDIYRNYW
jgi:2-methylcitrate dehydratase PrpD